MLSNTYTIFLLKFHNFILFLSLIISICGCKQEGSISNTNNDFHKNNILENKLFTSHYLSTELGQKPLLEKEPSVLEKYLINEEFNTIKISLRDKIYSNPILLKGLVKSLEKYIDEKDQNKKDDLMFISKEINKKLESNSFIEKENSKFKNIKKIFLKRFDSGSKQNFKNLLLKVNQLDSGRVSSEEEIKKLLKDLRLFTENFDEKILKQVQINNKSTAKNLDDIKKTRQDIMKIVKKNKEDIESNTKTLNETSESITTVVGKLESKIKLLKRHANLLLAIHVLIFVTALTIEIVLI